MALKGKKLTEEHKKKLSLSKIGILNPRFGISPWNKGKTLSDKTKQKIKEKRAKQIISQETKDKISKSMIGKFIREKSYNWKGGVTPINKQLRRKIEYKLWRKAVFERDNFTCQKTGQKGGKLVVHHINNFADFPELRTSIENGITLSLKAHQEFHKKYGIKNNSRSQIEEFLFGSQ